MLFQYDRLHIARVGRRAVEYLRGPCDPPHDFRQWSIVQVRQTGAELGTREKQVPQTFRLGLGLQILHDRHRRPSIGCAIDLLAVEIFIRRSEEHTSELQSLMRISYAVFCLKKKTAQI